MEKNELIKNGLEAFKKFISLSNEEVVEEKTKLQFAIITSIDRWDVEVDADVIEVGTQLKQIDSEGDTWSLSDGEYELEDGRKIQVDADGVVVMIGDGETPEEPTEEPATEEGLAEDVVTEEPATEEEEVPNELESRVEVLEAQLAELIDLINGNNETLSKQLVELSNEPRGVEVKLEKEIKEAKSYEGMSAMEILEIKKRK